MIDNNKNYNLFDIVEILLNYKKIYFFSFLLTLLIIIFINFYYKKVEIFKLNTLIKIKYDFDPGINHDLILTDLDQSLNIIIGQVNTRHEYLMDNYIAIINNKQTLDNFIDKNKLNKKFKNIFKNIYFDKYTVRNAQNIYKLNIDIYNNDSFLNSNNLKLFLQKYLIYTSNILSIETYDKINAYDKNLKELKYNLKLSLLKDLNDLNLILDYIIKYNISSDQFNEGETRLNIQIIKNKITEINNSKSIKNYMRTKNYGFENLLFIENLNFNIKEIYNYDIEKYSLTKLFLYSLPYVFILTTLLLLFWHRIKINKSL